MITSYFLNRWWHIHKRIYGLLVIFSLFFSSVNFRLIRLDISVLWLYIYKYICIYINRHCPRLNLLQNLSVMASRSHCKRKMNTVARIIFTYSHKYIHVCLWLHVYSYMCACIRICARLYVYIFVYLRSVTSMSSSYSKHQSDPLRPMNYVMLCILPSMVALTQAVSSPK